MTLTTRTVLMQRIIGPLGGYAGSITSGTAGTAVLGGLVGITNDDDFNDWLLYMPDASASGDQARIVTNWTGSSGTASFVPRATDTTYTSETYLLVPKGSWTLEELRDAVNKALRETRRSTRYVVPTVEHARQYQLSGLSWLRNARDVDAVFDRGSPNLLDNEDFSRWQNGTALAPDSWTLSGAAGTVVRQSTYASYGAYEAALTRAGADVQLTQTLPYALVRQLADAGATLALSVRCTATVATRARGAIQYGSGGFFSPTYTSYHTGGSAPETLTASVTLPTTANSVQVYVLVANGDTSASFDGVFLVEGSSVPDALTNAGSDGYHEQAIHYDILNAGSGVPMLSVEPRARGRQFVVTSRRPWATLSTDASTTEAPSDLIESRAIYELAAMFKPGVDRARMEALMRLHGAKFTKLAGGQIDKPVPSRGSVVVRSA